MPPRFFFFLPVNISCRYITTTQQGKQKLFLKKKTMAGQTKMIIITSDEDVIRRFSLNKNKNTQIIDLDNDIQITSTAKNIDLNFLAQLSELVRI